MPETFDTLDKGWYDDIVSKSTISDSPFAVLNAESVHFGSDEMVANISSFTDVSGGFTHATRYC